MYVCMYVGREWTLDVQICVKTFTTDRGPTTLAMSIESGK